MSHVDAYTNADQLSQTGRQNGAVQFYNSGQPIATIQQANVIKNELSHKLPEKSCPSVITKLCTPKNSYLLSVH